MLGEPREVPSMPAIDRFTPDVMLRGMKPKERQGYILAQQALSARPELFKGAVKRALVTLHNDSIWGLIEPPLDDVLFSKTREAIVRIKSEEVDFEDPDRVEAFQIFLSQVVDHGRTVEGESRDTGENFRVAGSQQSPDEEIPVNDDELDRAIDRIIEDMNRGPVYGQGGGIDG